MNPPAATQGAEYRRSRTNLLAALILVAGMYIYFLLFAQLGFLQGIRASGLGPAAVKVVLAAMAAAGIAASLSAPRVIFGFGRGGAMSLGLLLCASAAASAGFAFVSGVDGIGHLLIAAVGMGTGLGWATVGLAADLRRLTAGRDTGLCVGGGMAIAYFVSIIPAVYHAPPTTKAWIGAIVAATVIVLVGVSRGPQGGREAPDAGLVPPRWRSGRGLALAAAAFFALVWFDSVASAARQLAPGAYAREWGDDLARWTTGSVHAVAAIIVGGWLDRGHIRAVLGAAFAMLVAGAFSFDATGFCARSRRRSTSPACRSIRPRSRHSPLSLPRRGAATPPPGARPGSTRSPGGSARPPASDSPDNSGVFPSGRRPWRRSSWRRPGRPESGRADGAGAQALLTDPIMRAYHGRRRALAWRNPGRDHPLRPVTGAHPPRRAGIPALRHRRVRATLRRSAPMKILIVEDERKLGQFVLKGLQESAYTARLVGSCAGAEDALAESHYDAIVLDLGLPDGSGLDVLRRWRQAGFHEPVLILSARGQVEDRITGLNLGADDYLPKPFSFDELLARLRSLLRREGRQKQTRYEHGGVAMDLLSRKVTAAGQSVELTGREFALLELFLANPGRVLTRTQISERIWEAHFDSETNLIDVYVKRLRTKLPVGPEPLIRTIRGVGYMLP